MAEASLVDTLPALTAIRDIREHQKFPHNMELDIESLVLQAESRSIDEKTRKRASQLLTTRWNLAPERDADQAESIDINEQFDLFSPTEQKEILRNLSGIQLTQGCNGECPRCMFGKKKGVTAKYSFASLVRFFERFGSDLKSTREMPLYWDSDPFDYVDGEKTFVDVYREYRKYKPDLHHYVSTSVPRGGQQRFIDFLRFAITEQKGKESGKETLTVRISVTEHGVGRAEATLKQAVQTLIDDGHSEHDIQVFFSSCIQIANVTEMIPLGSQIHHHDDIKDIISPACEDGVVISPNRVAAVLITAASVLEPSGQLTIPLTPGTALRTIPENIHTDHYRGIPHTKALDIRYARKAFYLPQAMTSYRYEEIPFSSITDHFVFALGRDALTVAGLLEDITVVSRLPAGKKNGSSFGEYLVLVDKTNTYIREATMHFQEKRRRAVEQNIREAKMFSESMKISSPDEQRNLKYIIALSEKYLADYDYIHHLIHEKKESSYVVGSVSFLLRQIGKEQIPYQSEILLAVDSMDDVIQEERQKGPVSDVRAFIQEYLQKRVGIYFGLDTLSPEQYPKWYQYVVDALSVKYSNSTS